MKGLLSPRAWVWRSFDRGFAHTSDRARTHISAFCIFYGGGRSLRSSGEGRRWERKALGKKGRTDGQISIAFSS